MASSSRKSLSLRRQSSRNNMHDDELTRSLNRLSIATSPGHVSNPAHLSEPTTPFRSTARRGSSNSPRLASRSPSNGRDSRSATPTLLRKASMNSLRSSSGVGSGPTPTRRASAANILSPSAKMSPLSSTPPVPEKPRPTANSVAKDFFQAELQALHSPLATGKTQTTVILHDSVYGHRFSRPRTSKSALSTIVERPERVKAAVLGVSTAYVRLGGRHDEGAYPIHPRLNVYDIPTVPFRIHKTTRRLPLLSPAVTNVHGAKWMEELKMMCEAAESKLAMGGKELQRPDMSRGTNAPPPKFHEGDLYLCSESLEAMEGALGAVCEAVDTVFGPGPRRAFVAVRPPGHHCSASYPSGFCWVNNVHVGIMHAVLNHDLTHAAIIDIDLHHGDGSQSIAWDHNTRATTAAKNAAPWKKSSIGYFSLHDINSYPCEQGDPDKVRNASICIDNAHGQTIWNVHLQSWKTEEDFWRLYESKYTVILKKVRNYLRNQAERLKLSNQPPKAAIFFSTGFDASEWESAGMQRHQVNVPTEFYARIAQDVIKLAAEEGLHVDGRVISVMEGGYSDRAISSGVFSHLAGLVGDQQPLQPTGGLGYEMGHKIGVVPEQQQECQEEGEQLDSIHAYDASWWSGSRLDELESLLVDPASPPTKTNANSPAYYSPTQASTAKVVDPLRLRRSLSSLSRPPTPPPPEVPWTIAALELSKLLVPSDRQTESCKPEELNAEASRVRRDRQSTILGIPPASRAPTPATSRPTSRMALRERKAKPPPPVVANSKENASKGRRKTMGSALPTDKATETVGNQSTKKVGRRLSEAPTSLSSRTVSQSMARVPSAFGTRTNTAPPSPTNVEAIASGTVNVKKTRTVPVKKDPVPRVSRGPKKLTPAASNSKPATATGTQRAKSPGKAGPPVKADDDIDNITSGMKKIRINLITQTQKDAKERARVEAEKAAVAEEANQPALPPVLPSSSATVSPEPTDTDTGEISPRHLPSGFPTPPTAIPSSEISTPRQDQDPFSTPNFQRTIHLSDSPAIPSVAIQSGDGSPDVFIPYQPEGPVPIAIAQQEPLKWLPPASTVNTPMATPSPVKKQNNLFQYTTGIPFAPRSQEPAPNTDVQSKPDTP